MFGMSRRTNGLLLVGGERYSQTLPIRLQVSGSEGCDTPKGKRVRVLERKTPEPSQEAPQVCSEEGTIVLSR